MILAKANEPECAQEMRRIRPKQECEGSIDWIESTARGNGCFV